MTLPTNFAATSPVGRMWSELLAQAKKEGRDIDALERETDRGFDKGLPIFGLKLPQNISGTIEAEEALEYAYSQPAYFRILQKYGFPIPYEMDDQDPQTKIARTDIEAIVKNNKAKLAKTGLVPSSDIYRRELAHLIYNDLFTKTSTWADDCAEEAPGWKAYTVGCGACTELSALLYYAYRAADLKPVFLGLSRTSPNLSELAMFATGTLPGHEYVGVPLANGGVLGADLAMRRFDAKEENIEPPAPNQSAKDQYVVKMTPRQAAEMFLQNRRNDAKSDAEYNTIMGSLAQIAPATSTFAFMALYLRLGQMTVSELDQSLQGILGQYGSSDINLYRAQDARSRQAFLQGRHLDFGPQITQLNHIADPKPAGSGMPEHACFLATTLAVTLIDRLDASARTLSTPEQMQAFRTQKAAQINLITDLIEKAIKWEPTYYYAFVQLSRLSPKYLTPDESLQFLDRLAKNNPDHAFIQFRRADLLVAKAYQATKSEDRLATLNEGNAIARTLIGKTAPNDFMARALAAHYAEELYHPQEAVLQAREAFSHLPAQHPYVLIACRNILSIAINVGDMQLVRKIINRLKIESPSEWPSLVEQVLREKEVLFYFRNKVPKQPAEISAVAARVASLLDELAKAGLPKNKVEELAAMHSIIALMTCHSQFNAADPLLNRISDKKAPHVVQAFKDAAQNFMVPFAEQAKLTGENIQRAAKTIDAVDALLAPQDRLLLADAYRKISLAAIEFGNEAIARSALHHVTALPGSAGASWFYDECCGVRVTDSDPAAARKKEAQRVLAALRVLWGERSVIDAALSQKAENSSDYVSKMLAAISDAPDARAAAELAKQFQSLRSITAKQE